MSQTSSRLGVVILGAGASARMGRPKLLLPWCDTTVIGQLVAQWREMDAGQIAIVMRPNDAALNIELDRLDFLKANRIENPRSERGMFSSIVCAAHWNGWRAELSRWALVLGDQPHLQPETLRQVLAVAVQNREAICQPAFGGHTRHPVILPQRAMAELKNSSATTLKEYLKLTRLPRVQCSVADPGLSLDMDTPEDYKRLTSSHQPV